MIIFGLTNASVFDVTWKCPDLERIIIPASSVGPNFIRQIKYRCNFNYKCFYNKESLLGKKSESCSAVDSKKNLLQEFSEGYCSAKVKGS